MRSYRVSVSVGIAFGLLLHAAKAISQQPGKDLPTYTLSLVKAEPLTAAVPSPMLEGPVGCLSDGSFVVHSILDMDPSRPSDPNTMVLSVIGRNRSVQTFDLQKITDLKQVHDTYQYDVGSRDVALLVAGEPKGSEANPNADLKRYIARFDIHGAYQGSVALPDEIFKTRKMALFDSGDLLLFGTVKGQSGAQLGRYSPIGGRTLLYNPDTPLVAKNATLPAQPGEEKFSSELKNQLAMEGAIDLSQFVHHKESLLLLQRNAGSTLYEIDPDGAIITISLPQQDGFTADSVVTSNESLYVRYRRAGTNNGRGDNAFILEVNPSTGDAIRKIRSPVSTVWDVSCVYNGDFTIVKLKDEHTFEFLTARPQ